MRRWVQGRKRVGQRWRLRTSEAASYFPAEPRRCSGPRLPGWNPGGALLGEGPPQKNGLLRPLAAPPAGPRDPARTSRPPRLATPGRVLGEAPPPRETDQPEEGEGGACDDGQWGWSSEGSNRLVGRGEVEGASSGGGARGAGARNRECSSARARAEPSPSPGAPSSAGVSEPGRGKGT